MIKSSSFESIMAVLLRLLRALATASLFTYHLSALRGVDAIPNSFNSSLTPRPGIRLLWGRWATTTGGAVRRAVSQDPSCPDGFLCNQQSCPAGIECPEGDVCIDFEGAIACAMPGLKWCAFNPDSFQGVGCLEGL